jgi:hypothetical protein
MYIKSLAENLVQKALLLFEILSFEVYCRSDRLPDSTIRGVGDSPYQRYAESATPRIVESGSRAWIDVPSDIVLLHRFKK